jgi:hypothetical protein
VIRPEAPERTGLLTHQRSDELGQLIGVLPDRRVRRLREVLVVAQPAAHQIGGEYRVLAEQRL